MGVSVMATMSLLSASVAQHMQMYTTFLIHSEFCTAFSQFTYLYSYKPNILRYEDTILGYYVFMVMVI